MLSAAELSKRLRAVQMLVCDVDGVLTDGRLGLDNRGTESKWFSSQDGLGLSLARDAGLVTAFLTARRSRVVQLRARECRISWVVQGCREKAGGFASLCRRAGIKPGRAAYLGDDLIDLPVFPLAGLALAVANAVPEVKAAAHWVTRASGGAGAVRETIEKILKAQGRWDGLVARFLGSHETANKK